MTAEDVRFPGPHPTAETAPYWRHAASRRLRLLHCDDCARPFHYPRMVCPWCWGESLTWVDASGSGIIETFTAVRRPAHPAFSAEAPYVCAVVRLAEGPALMMNMVSVEPHVGQPVQILFVDRGGWTLPVAASLTSTQNAEV